MMLALRKMSSLLRNRHGGVALEFAFIAPILFMFVLGTIDLGRYLWTFNTVQRAADESVRVGAVQDLSNTQVQTLAKDLLVGMVESGFTVQVNPSGTPSDTLRVRITNNYETIYPMAFIQPTLAISVTSDFPI